jgi:transcriptional regulator with XRE-family HTH domain
MGTKALNVDVARATALYREDVPMVDIAAAVGCSVTTLKQRLTAYGVVLNRRPGTRRYPIDTKRAVALRAKGLSHERIAARFGCARSTVSRCLAEHDRHAHHPIDPPCSPLTVPPSQVDVDQDQKERHLLLDELVRVRKASGVSQTDIARRMGVNSATVSMFENRTDDPRLSTVQRYARAIGVRLPLTVTPQANDDIRTGTAPAPDGKNS